MLNREQNCRKVALRVVHPMRSLVSRRSAGIIQPKQADHIAHRLGWLSPSAGTSSVNTLNPVNWHGPNEVDIATSVASRPRAIRMRPMRGTLCRASNVYQRSPRNTSNKR